MPTTSPTRTRRAQLPVGACRLAAGQESGDGRVRRLLQRYAKDVLRDPFYRKLENGLDYFGIILPRGSCCSSPPALPRHGWRRARPARRRSSASACSSGRVPVRTVVNLHNTWAGQFGDPYVGLPELRDRRGEPQQSRVGYPSAMGEGWHNNHHADPRSARHGHRWWELDITYLTIRLLGLVGLTRSSSPIAISWAARTGSSRTATGATEQSASFFVCGRRTRPTRSEADEGVGRTSSLNSARVRECFGLGSRVPERLGDIAELGEAEPPSITRCEGGLSRTFPHITRGSCQPLRAGVCSQRGGELSFA